MNLSAAEIDSCNDLAAKIAAKRAAREEQPGDNIEAAAPRQPHKQRFDWDVLGPKALAMKGEGKSAAQIGKELGVPPGTMWAWLKRNGDTTAQEDIGPPGHEDISLEPEQAEAVSETPKPEPVDIRPGGGLLPNTTKLIAVNGEYQLRIFERFHQQRQKGIGKYGQPLEENSAGMDERLEHLAQELTDGLMYIEWLKAHQPENGPLLGLPDVAWQNFPEWTIASQVKKIHEEAGEVAEAIINGDWVAAGQEALDTIQTCKTLLSMLAAKGLEVEDLLEGHADKLARKGYV